MWRSVLVLSAPVVRGLSLVDCARCTTGASGLMGPWSGSARARSATGSSRLIPATVFCVPKNAPAVGISDSETVGASMHPRVSLSALSVELLTRRDLSASIALTNAASLARRGYRSRGGGRTSGPVHTRMGVLERPMVARIAICTHRDCSRRVTWVQCVRWWAQKRRMESLELKCPMATFDWRFVAAG